MRRALLFAALMSVSFPALAITANMPGDPCPSQFGVTKLSDDKANIVACLQASGADATLIWKATTQGGGMTGGCSIAYSLTQSVFYIAATWGKGCKPVSGPLSVNTTVPTAPIVTLGPLVTQMCIIASAPGYACGFGGVYPQADNNSPGGTNYSSVFCQCTNSN